MKDINAFYSYEAVGEKKRVPLILITFLCISIVITLVYFTLANYLEIQNLKKEHDQSMEIISSKEKIEILREIEDTGRKIGYIEEYSEVLIDINKNIVLNDIIKDEFIQEVFNIVPKGVSINSLSFNRAELVLECSANDLEYTGHMLYNLKNMGIFHKVYTPNVNEDEAGKHIFTVTCAMKDVNYDE